MKRILFVIFGLLISILFEQCGSEIKQDEKQKSKEITIDTMASAKSIEVSRPATAQVAEQVSNDIFDLKIGDSLAAFLKALPDLKPYIHPVHDLTCLEPEPGVYPLRSVLEDEPDAMGKTPFMYLVRDFHIISQTVITSLPKDFSYCEEIKDGFYFMDAPKDLLSAAYRLEQGNIG